MASKKSGGSPPKQKKSPPKEKKKRGQRGKTVLKKVIILRNKLGKIPVEWNVKGQPVGQYRSLFRSHIGVIVRQEVSITLTNWKDASDETRSISPWDIDETRMTYVLSSAGDSLKTFRVRLNRWRKEKNAMHPPKEYADSISQEEWEEFVAYCTSPDFELKETNSQETFLPRYKLYRAARFNKNGEIDNENAHEIVRKILLLNYCYCSFAANISTAVIFYFTVSACGRTKWRDNK
ncbi:hypothetical protein RIF29_31729 [Crotalaria pallida]|uniref:Uncharacterized protein n=1 Tax=Crotalaria pallida TaxID=3830 RepID=A0AAN9EHG6_CROPI